MNSAQVFLGCHGDGSASFHAIPRPSNAPSLGDSGYIRRVSKPFPSISPTICLRPLYRRRIERWTSDKEINNCVQKKSRRKMTRVTRQASRRILDSSVVLSIAQDCAAEILNMNCPDVLWAF